MYCNNFQNAITASFTLLAYLKVCVLSVEIQLPQKGHKKIATQQYRHSLLHPLSCKDNVDFFVFSLVWKSRSHPA